MIRVIGGRFRGRKIRLPDTAATRPVTDRAREAAFNILGDVEGLTVLDLYSGSGAFAFEALSRHAARATVVDVDANAVAAIVATAEDLGVTQQLEVAQAGVAQWFLRSNTQFDLVFADPPYELQDWHYLDRVGEVMTPQATLVLKHRRRQEPPVFKNLDFKLSRNYASTRLSFYKK